MAHPIPPIDVRDMVCAQAMAILSQAVTPLVAGETVTVLMNAEDVRRDVLAWSQHRGVMIERLDQLANHEERLTLRVP